MITRTPSFYHRFQCIGSACQNSCCIGWELEIDPQTFSYYRSLTDGFGKRLQEFLDHSQKDEDTENYILSIAGRCPFLDKQNLCEIVKHLGEEALCDICHTYPRYSFTYDDTTDLSLTISCEEACRLLLEAEGFVIEESGASEALDESLSFKKKEAALFATLSDRSQPILTRILSILPRKDAFFLEKAERLYILTLLEPINSEWVDILRRMQESDSAPTFSWDDLAYEKIIQYFLFRYLPRSLFDENFDAQLEFCVFCTLCIRDIEEITGSIQEAASFFSRQVEHSEENIECIMEELLF